MSHTTINFASRASQSKLKGDSNDIKRIEALKAVKEFNSSVEYAVYAVLVHRELTYQNFANQLSTIGIEGYPVYVLWTEVKDALHTMTQ